MTTNWAKRQRKKEAKQRRLLRAKLINQGKTPTSNKKKKKIEDGTDGYVTRSKVLTELGYSCYQEYLKSPTYFTIKKKLLFGKSCRGCGVKAQELHHTSYNKATLTGNDLSHIHPLCKDCHNHCEFDEERKLPFTKVVEKTKRLLRAYKRRIKLERQKKK